MKPYRPLVLGNEKLFNSTADGQPTRAKYGGSETGTSQGFARNEQSVPRELSRPRLPSDILPSKEGKYPALNVFDRQHSGASAFSGVAGFDELAGQDLEMFWRWCPVPLDGLHRCAMLVKLFDYAGLTRKECKIALQVRRLDQELRSLRVFPTDQFLANQRITYNEFVKNPRLREAVAKWSENAGNGAQRHPPLAGWVLTIIRTVEIPPDYLPAVRGV
eukprot:TRINITY_DN122083_c0_g1_i1.p1 TRINITY_DN122083_c0_g1~~TRINITY_DN122083_c0_g1_i1.p1  ORF type:complete len:218 (+),score=22.36 TRINITY_DN122083_c0_g1_i1:164-817(+)